MDLELLKLAKPVFLEGLEDDVNIQAGFATVLDVPDVSRMEGAFVLVTARNFYRLYVNGIFVAHGPARTCDGYLRADCVDIGKYLKIGKNYIAFEVTSYGNMFGYANDVVLGKGLLRAAVKAGDTVVLSSPETFRGVRLAQREQLAERISHCRQMAENYILDRKYTEWRTDFTLLDAKVAEVDDASELLPRGCDYPTLELTRAGRLIDAGLAEIDENVPFDDAWFEKPLAHYKELKERPLRDYVRTVEKPAREGVAINYEKGVLTAEGLREVETFYALFDLGNPQVGFVEIDAETEKAGIVDVVHLESFAVYGDKDEFSGGANPVLRLHTEGGRVRFTSMEPVLARFVKVYFRGCGNVKLNSAGVREYTVPDSGSVCGAGSFLCSDEDVNRIYEAARLTLRLNALDVFMDCPDRERGGWLCDSYWTGRAEGVLLGNHRIEKNFLENFLLTDPEKMWNAFFPEVYPAYKSSFSAGPGITTWSFWLLEELCCYVKASGDRELAERFRPRIEAFVKGSLGLIGGSGLFENLPCIFIDWSYSNEGVFNGPVSTAANALYSKMLRDLGALYGNSSWTKKGLEMRRLIREAIGIGIDGSAKKGYKGPEYIPDSLRVDENGRLRPNGLTTEAATYLTIWSEIFDPDEAPLTVFNAVRAMGASPEFFPSARVGRAGLFIGLQYRFDMLAKLGERARLLQELKSFYGAQLKEGPGTLWEGRDIRQTSYCHGFNSYAGLQLVTEILGIGVPDETTKTVRISPCPCGGIRWAKGCVNTSDGLISLSWVDRGGGKIETRLTLPDGWKATD